MYYYYYDLEITKNKQIVYNDRVANFEPCIQTITLLQCEQPICAFITEVLQEN